MFTALQDPLSPDERISHKSSEESPQNQMEYDDGVPYHGNLAPDAQKVVEDEWKSSSRLLQELYRLILNEERGVQTFHVWLQMLDYNLTPNMRDLSIEYQSADCTHDDYSLTRISFRANADSMNRKIQIQILAFDDALNHDLDHHNKVPWDIFLKELETQHETMYKRGEIEGDYDCFVAYRQYARLYTLHGAETPNLRQVWVRFTEEKMRLNHIQPLATDPHDSGPLFEFKVHYTLIKHLLRAFAWNINIPYMRTPV
ncbi:hypothetical protein PISL3812_06058 [Talaromyces islandicus]|uniref:Uncharacterized protein n=1 Tax=Talaromyces islandicus TaxID=28573 RepID=A0A0U1M0E6_TALIS|nr:hypothetical protein PISL3812_06058 [Talaromyces islandicus]